MFLLFLFLQSVNSFSLMAPAVKLSNSPAPTSSPFLPPLRTTTSTRTSTLPTPTTATIVIQTTAAANGSDANVTATAQSVADWNSTTSSSLGKQASNNVTENHHHWDESEESHESVEFLETVNGDKLVKGEKVIEIKTQWNTHVGDDDAEATE